MPIPLYLKPSQHLNHGIEFNWHTQVTRFGGFLFTSFYMFANVRSCGKPEVAKRIENGRFPPDPGRLVVANISGN
jgi:hypothetical protein